MPYSDSHKAKSKNRILQSATELFCRDGFAKVSIGQVMKLAKMTHGAFYNHFESKEALYRAAFNDALQRSKTSRLIKGPYSLQHLTNLVTGYLNLRDLSHSDAPSSDAFLSINNGNESQELKTVYERSYLDLVKLIERRLIALTRLKESPLSLAPGSVPQKARAIIASMVGAVAIAKNIDNNREKEAVLQAAQQQILSMFAVR